MDLAGLANCGGDKVTAHLSVAGKHREGRKKRGVELSVDGYGLGISEVEEDVVIETTVAGVLALVVINTGPKGGIGAGYVDDDGGPGGRLYIEGMIGVAELCGRDGEDVQR